MGLCLSCLDTKSQVLKIFTIKSCDEMRLDVTFFDRFFKKFEILHPSDLKQLLNRSHHVVFHCRFDKILAVCFQHLSRPKAIRTLISFYQSPVVFTAKIGSYKVSWVFDRLRPHLQNPLLLLKGVKPDFKEVSIFKETSQICGYQGYFYVQFLFPKISHKIPTPKALTKQNAFILKKDDRIYLDHLFDAKTSVEIIKQQLFILDELKSHEWIPKEFIFHLFERLKDAKTEFLCKFLEITELVEAPCLLLYQFFVKLELKKRAVEIELDADEKFVKELYESCFTQGPFLDDGKGLFPDLKLRKILALIIPKDALSHQISFLMPKDEQELEEYLASSGPFYYLGLLEALKNKETWALIDKWGVYLHKLDRIHLRPLVSLATLQGADQFLKKLFFQMQHEDFVSVKKEIHATFLICISSIHDETLCYFFSESYLKSFQRPLFFNLLDRALLSSRTHFVLYLMHMKKMTGEEIDSFIDYLLIQKNNISLANLLALPLIFFRSRKNLVALESKFREKEAFEAIFELIKIFPECAKSNTEVLKLPEKGFERYFQTCPKRLYKAYLMRACELSKQEFFQQLFVTYNDQLTNLEQYELLEYAITNGKEKVVSELVEYLEISKERYRALFLKFVQKFNKIAESFFNHTIFVSMSILEKKEFLCFLLKNLAMTNICFAFMLIKKVIREDEILGDAATEGLFSLFMKERNYKGLYILKHASCVTQKHWDDFFETLLLKRDFIPLVREKLERAYHLNALQIDMLVSQFIDGTISRTNKSFMIDMIVDEKKADIKLLKKFTEPQFPKISDKTAHVMHRQILALKEEGVDETVLALRQNKKDVTILFSHLISMHLFDGRKLPEGVDLPKRHKRRENFSPKLSLKDF